MGWLRALRRGTTERGDDEQREKVQVAQERIGKRKYDTDPGAFIESLSGVEIKDHQVSESDLHCTDFVFIIIIRRNIRKHVS